MAIVKLLEIQISEIRVEAPAIHSLELRPVEGEMLPPFTAGAHIDLYLRADLIRSYSLINSQNERHRYVIAVQKDPSSRGGSQFIHEQVFVGDRLTISEPRNNFPLDEEADHSVLIAGGIGITPLLSMVRRLEELGRSWTLYYCSRTARGAAFRHELRQLESPRGKLIFNFDHDPGGKLLDVASVILGGGTDAHFYCCGPLPLLHAFEEATQHLPRERVHVEYFTAKEAPARGGDFTVVLARSGLELAVGDGQSILDVILDAGIDVPFACMQGVCGTCETTVLAGVPDHRDLVLTESQRQSNNVMMICCSGCKSERLVLDA